MARALEVDFGPFVDHALASGEMYRTVLSAAYKTFLSRASDAAMAEVRYVQKTRAWLAAQERWEDLERAEDYFREFRMLPPDGGGGRVTCSRSRSTSSRAHPAGIRAMSPLETRFDAAVFRPSGARTAASTSPAGP